MNELPEGFALNVAAEAFRIPTRQLEDDLKHGRFPHANRRERYIPYEDLVAAGYSLDPRWLRSWRSHLKNAERIRKTHCDGDANPGAGNQLTPKQRRHALQLARVVAYAKPIR